MARRSATAEIGDGSEVEVPDSIEGQDVEASEATEGAEVERVEGEGPKSGRPKGSKGPEYNIAKVEGGLPDEPPVERGRAAVYLNLLQQIMGDEGEWYEIAHFKTPTGARTAEKALMGEGKEKREIPEGKWEFAARKIINEADPQGKRHSKLFARYLGEDDEADEQDDNEALDEQVPEAS